MTTNCQWCQSKLEAYFSEELNQEDLGLFQGHLTSCGECRQQVQELRDIDPMVNQVLHRRLALARLAAQRNTGPRVWRVALAGSGIALAAILGIGMLTLRQEVPAPVVATAPPIFIEPAAVEPIKDKAPQGSAAPQRAKPEDGVSVPPAPQSYLDDRPAEGPDFVIIDADGYARTLETYRERILLFGVVSSDQKEAIANLQELYQAFGSNPNVRILGVANHRDDKDKIEGATFPIWFNHASKLLGVQNSQFLLVDAMGSSRLKGSLANAADVARARTQLGQLTAK